MIGNGSNKKLKEMPLSKDQLQRPDHIILLTSFIGTIVMKRIFFKNTIGDGGSTALLLLTLLTLSTLLTLTVDTVETVDSVDTVDTVDSVDTVDNAGVKEYFLIECRMQNSRRIF